MSGGHFLVLKWPLMADLECLRAHLERLKGPLEHPKGHLEPLKGRCKHLKVHLGDL